MQSHGRQTQPVLDTGGLEVPSDGGAHTREVGDLGEPAQRSLPDTCLLEESRKSHCADERMALLLANRCKEFQGIRSMFALRACFSADELFECPRSLPLHNSSWESQMQTTCARQHLHQNAATEDSVAAGGHRTYSEGKLQRTSLLRKIRRGGKAEHQNIVLRSLLLCVAVSILSDILKFTVGFRGDQQHGFFLPGAAAQNVTCPENALLITFWPQQEGVGAPLLRCQCRTGYFDTSTSFFRGIVEKQANVPILDCTPKKFCPRMFPLPFLHSAAGDADQIMKYSMTYRARILIVFLFFLQLLTFAQMLGSLANVQQQCFLKWAQTVVVSASVSTKLLSTLMVNVLAYRSAHW